MVRRLWRKPRGTHADQVRPWPSGPEWRSGIRSKGWPGGRNPISTVEVKIDNGPWQKAKLDGSKAPFTWQDLDIGLEADTG